MSRRAFFNGCFLALIAGVLLGAVSCKGRSAGPPNHADGVTLDFDVVPLSGGPAGGKALTEETVQLLLRRLDAEGTGNIRVQAIGPTRVEVWMEYPKACQKLWEDMEAAAADFGPTTLPATGTAASEGISREHLEHLLRTGNSRQYDDFLAAHPDKKVAIERYFNARHQLLLARGDAVRDPEELANLVMARGDMAFRIAVTPAELDAPGEIGKDAAELSLKKEGPGHEFKVGGMAAKWYPMDEVERMSVAGGNFVVSGSEPAYMLCYDDPAASMTHERGPAWTILAGSVVADPSTGRIALPFRLDKSGGVLMGELSGKHLRSALAIILDDEVLEAPSLQSRIMENGEITMGGTNPAAERREAERMRSLLNTSRFNAAVTRSDHPPTEARR